MLPDLLNTLLRHAASAWTRINRTQFRSAMKPPSFALSDAESQLACWVAGSRCIRLSEALFTGFDWIAVLEVLRHEMAHQYVTEVLQVHDESPHGPAFQRVCAEYGIDPTAAGVPDPAPSREEARIVRRIRALLALADSPNEHEAKAAARKAYTLMHRHNVALLSAADVHYAVRRIGPIKKRFQAYEKALGGLLGRHFFVQPVYVSCIDTATGESCTTLEVSGRPDNLAMAAHVYTWLEATGERLFRTYKKRRGIRSNRERRRFLLGLVQGFARQLVEQQQVCEETGLVWVGDAGLDAFVAQRHPRLRASRRLRVQATDAYRSGIEEGRKLELKRPVTAGPSGTIRALTSNEPPPGME